MGTILHLIEIISFWDKVLHTVSPMVLTAVGYGLICMFLKDVPVRSFSMAFSSDGICFCRPVVFWGVLGVYLRFAWWNESAALCDARRHPIHWPRGIDGYDG